MKFNVNKENFYQSKYEFYRTFSLWSVIVASFACATYFVSDCQLMGRFAWETILPRIITFLPLAIYILLYKKTTSYKVMVIASYVMLHLIMWNTIWAVAYLPDKSHTNEGFIVMHLMFLALGFCAPFSYSTPAHILVVANILISNLFNHYNDLDTMLSIGIPCIGAICAVNFCMQKLYFKHYLVTKKMEKISFYDSLTGAYNRNIINNITNANHKEFIDSFGQNVGVMMFDIDHFKAVNDTYGHIMGDQVLKELSKIIMSNLDEQDYIIRWGGEEFVVLLPHSDKNTTYECAENLRKCVEKSDNGVCPVTISIGMAMYDGEDYKVAIDSADKALYNAKNGGRNRVEVFE